MIIPLRSTSSAALIGKIMQRWISVFGYPEEIITDNGSNFVSAEFKSFCATHGIKKSESSPYHPQTMGIVERQFRTIKDMISATTKQNGCDWFSAIPKVEMGLRASKCSTTSLTPHEVIFGESFQPPPALRTKSQPQQLQPNSQQQQQRRVASLKAHKRRKIATQQPSQPKVIHRYVKGDLVMVRSREQQPTSFLSPRFLGPCEIISVLSPTTYMLTLNGQHLIRNDIHLKRWCGRDIPPADSQSSYISLCGHQDVSSNDCTMATPQTAEGHRRYPQRERQTVERYS